MFIQAIQITNFKSIYDEVKFDFNNIKGLWKISGIVGAGKTTIGEAIIYGLFGTVSGKNNSDLISWGRKHGKVEIWCISKGRSIYIKREMNTYGQSPMYVEVDGEELIFTNKRDAQLQLEKEYYDTSRVTLELLCIISFNNFKSLATLNSADTKKFLDQVLGFYILTEYANTCKEFEITSNNQITESFNEMSNIVSQITKLEEMANHSKIDGNIEDVRKDLKTCGEQINIYNKIISDAREEMNKSLKEITAKKSEIVTLGKNKAKEIKFIEQGTCPTCGAPIDQSQLETKRKEKEALGKAYKTYLSEEESVKNKFNSIDNATAPKIDIYNKKQSQLHTLLIQLQEQEKHININTDEIISLEHQKEDYQQVINEYQSESNEWSQLYNIISNDIRSKILSSFIPVLNKNILKYTQRLQQPYLIEFDANFKCKVSLAGLNQEISISSLSTGQLKTVDMIIILGVLGTIIGSNGINIIFLDELFSNLDAGLRNEMCSVLKESLKDGDTMFIISHQEMDSRYFDGEINMKLEQKNDYEKHSIPNIKTY